MTCEKCEKCEKQSLKDENDSLSSLTTVLSLMLPMMASQQQVPDIYNNLQARVEMLEDELTRMKKLLLR